MNLKHCRNFAKWSHLIEFLLFLLESTECGSGVFQFDIHIIKFLLHLLAPALQLVVISSEIRILNSKDFQLLGKQWSLEWVSKAAFCEGEYITNRVYYESTFLKPWLFFFCQNTALKN